MIHTHEGHGIGFAVWTGHGRDPQVAYLDARLFAIATSELGKTGWLLYGSGVSYNALGGERRGAIDPAALHRMVHAVVDGRGAPYFELSPPCERPVGTDGMCETARREPRPGTPAEPAGSFVIGEGFALRWVTWEDVVRRGVMRRAEYMDEHFLLEAGLGHDGAVRAWPARGLMAHGLELVTPAASELIFIEERITSLTRAAGEGAGFDPARPADRA